MKTEWNHLPNAVHIDRIIASVKAHPEVWDAALFQLQTAALEAELEAELEAAWEAAWDQAREVAKAQARDEAWRAARYAARDEVLVEAWNAAGGAVLALVAWDHSAKFLDMTANELKMWSILSEDPAAILLLPAVIAFEQLKELELVDS